MQNGMIPVTFLAMTSGGKPLALQPASGFERLATAFRLKFGKALVFGAGWTGYRSLEQQKILFDQKGYPNAAYPGSSNHGWGTAADLSSGVQVYGSAEWKWMNTVGRTYGWRPLNENNLTFEPWHWVYNASLDTYPGQETPVADGWNDNDRYAQNLILGAVGRIETMTANAAPDIDRIRTIQAAVDLAAANVQNAVNGIKTLLDRPAAAGSVLASLSDADIAKISKAVNDESARRQAN